MDERLTVGSLFSGIGGFDLGFERAGMRTLWFCEQDPFCQRVLAKHWPGVPCHPDVRALVADTGRWGVQCDGGSRELAGSTRGAEGEGDQRQRDGHAVGDGGAAADMPVPVPYVDVLCGGFPCQDISLAGRGAGLAGERSGLWREFARLIGELRPRYVVIENVPALTSRGLDVVLADLAARGLDAEWDHLPASAFGAPHRRDRIWLVAYPASGGSGAQWPLSAAEAGADAGASRAGDALADTARHGAEAQAPAGAVGERTRASGERGRARDVGDPDPERRNGRAGELGPRRRGEPSDAGWWEPQPGLGLLADGLPSELGGHWDREPDIVRVATGVPERVNKLRALGNALVPQIAEWIGRRIVKYENLNDGQEAA